MSNFTFSTASRKRAKLRIGMFGVSGSGKTYSSLLLASGLVPWEKIFLIDTEQGSGELYSDLGPYLHANLTAPFSPDRYIEIIGAAVGAGAECIVIDSVSHEWDGDGGCLDLHSKLGGQFHHWAKVTPKHRRFLDTILQAPCHVITTARKKQDYAMEKESNGKAKITKVGLKDVQRDGFEYELTVAFTIDQNHLAVASKDRTGLFKVDEPFIITKETGELISNWNSSGIGSNNIPSTSRSDGNREGSTKTKTTPKIGSLQKISGSGLKLLFAKAKENRWLPDDVKAFARKHYHVQSRADLTNRMKDHLINVMESNSFDHAMQQDYSDILENLRG